MTPSIIDKTIDQAVRNLTASGCKFAIITPDGRQLGELILEAPKKPVRKHVNDFASTGYTATIKAMQVGEVAVFESDRFNPAAYRGAISACACSYFGPGNATSTIRDGKIELLRLA